VRVLIVGSGPAAAAAALALTSSRAHEVHVIDAGESLEASRQALLEEMKALPPVDWPPQATTELTTQPLSKVPGDLPQKRLYGSDFPFRDVGQLVGVTVQRGGNRSCISGAYGGFSNVWGAQVMPFTRETIDEWPVTYDQLLPHYTAVLRHIPFAGADDDYSELFPLLAPAAPLPRLAPGAAAALQRYAAHRHVVRRRGVVLARARLALASQRCIECGLCLTGCPYGLIYSSAQTFDPLIARGTVRYRAGVLAHEVGEDDEGCWVVARDIATREPITFRGDRILLACGPLGTARVVVNSARRQIRRLEFLESMQFVLPFFSTRAYPDPRSYSTFTLNQFNMLVQYGRPGFDLAHLHLYPYNPAFEDELPKLVRTVDVATKAILRRATAALGYLPSWVSPKLVVEVRPGHGGLPPVAISSAPNPDTSTTLRRVMRRVLGVSAALDLWPGLPALRVSGPGKSYHFGGSFPHVRRPRPTAVETDTLGRLPEWRRIHLVDGAVLPSVPATTFTLSVMANAHRIATQVASEAA
jgi:ferredoxin